jgi:protein-S-isoprenylcysteine O-methyltransferase Ste14
MSGQRRIIASAIALYFIIGLEVLVMISPFAAFFYSAFNPFLLFLARWPATHWLADFFLPHMVLPPDGFLKGLRVAGSVLFVGGAALFLVCAAQVYSHKFMRRGPVLGGLYRWIRHPQYLALAITGVGLAILWPRFLTVVLWAVMIGLYYFLARDEEKRMLAEFGDQYAAYMSRTGMFLPKLLEQGLLKIAVPVPPVLRVPLALALVLVLSVGSAFALRSYTVAKLPLWSDGRVTVLAILPGDAVMVQFGWRTFCGFRRSNHGSRRTGGRPRLHRSHSVRHAGNDRGHRPRVPTLRGPPDHGDDRRLDLSPVPPPRRRPRHGASRFDGGPGSGCIAHVQKDHLPASRQQW